MACYGTKPGPGLPWHGLTSRLAMVLDKDQAFVVWSGGFLDGNETLAVKLAEDWSCRSCPGARPSARRLR